ncbi:MAG: uroporphyrinogen decarboxylase family protein [Armatimonadota bacterium]|nr:uroporphyrinogen decarboxylase family protein [Armatimonadota bacterium]
MTSRERIKTIYSGKAADRCGFWLGMPHKETWPIYLEHFGFTEQEELRRFLHDDFRWMGADGGYKHPDGKPPFEMAIENESGVKIPVFADCENVAEVEAYDWPNPDYLDFTDQVERVRQAGDVYRASGLWTCFFHIVAWYFGMENYFIKMHTNPAVVEAVTSHVCEYYLEANKRFFEAAGDEVDAFFFGNDYGTQLDLIISPESFDKFVFPWIRKFSDLGHAHGLQVMTHCCGAVNKVIGRFIDAGIDALHPLQARALNMDAEKLARDFKGKIAFAGGIDTQDLLVNGSPDDVRAEVRRVKNLLGPCYVVSPSHEALLPNVPPENVLAMAETALEDY